MNTTMEMALKQSLDSILSIILHWLDQNMYHISNLRSVYEDCIEDYIGEDTDED